jgi:glycosyltransferase involved in cell wall biosynthesis
MRIGLDAHYIGARAGGNETHVRNLLEGLHSLHTAHEFIVFCRPDMQQTLAQEYGFQTAAIPVHSSYLRVPLALPWLARKFRLDLLHLHYTAPPVCPCPFVLTMHDLVAFRFPESLPILDRYRLQLLSGHSLRRAAQIFTVSHAVKQEIMARFHMDATRITVTPNALHPRYLQPISPQARATIRKKHALPERYVLFVGLIQPRKNLDHLAAAFAQLRERGYPHTLVIAGRKAWLHEAMLHRINALGLADRLHFTGYVNDDELPALYAEAEVFAFPSAYEGFGIPIIEALACGTPVLASPDPALVEVAGGGALHVEPHDTHAMTDALARLIDDATLRAALLDQGRPHALAYTTARMAQAAIEGYEAAALR